MIKYISWPGDIEKMQQVVFGVADTPFTEALVSVMIGIALIVVLNWCSLPT